MGEVVNLRLARKRAAREAKDARAERNRTVYGCSKAEREGASLEREREAVLLEGHRREPDEPA